MNQESFKDRIEVLLYGFIDEFEIEISKEQKDMLINYSIELNDIEGKRGMGIGKFAKIIWLFYYYFSHELFVIPKKSYKSINNYIIKIGLHTNDSSRKRIYRFFRSKFNRKTLYDHYKKFCDENNIVIPSDKQALGKRLIKYVEDEGNEATDPMIIIGGLLTFLLGKDDNMEFSLLTNREPFIIGTWTNYFKKISWND